MTNFIIYSTREVKEFVINHTNSKWQGFEWVSEQNDSSFVNLQISLQDTYKNIKPNQNKLRELVE